MIIEKDGFTREIKDEEVLKIFIQAGWKEKVVKTAKK